VLHSHVGQQIRGISVTTKSSIGHPCSWLEALWGHIQACFLLSFHPALSQYLRQSCTQQLHECMNEHIVRDNFHQICYIFNFLQNTQRKRSIRICLNSCGWHILEIGYLGRDRATIIPIPSRTPVTFIPTYYIRDLIDSFQQSYTVRLSPSFYRLGNWDSKKLSDPPTYYHIASKFQGLLSPRCHHNALLPFLLCIAGTEEWKPSAN
jgi:hypothetical protein